MDLRDRDRRIAHHLSQQHRQLRLAHGAGRDPARHDRKGAAEQHTCPPDRPPRPDLTGALTNIFNHPNVGPFVCRQLIQHLVASNPSPAYVARVAAVFANDGTGVRGNMKAVIQAILMDPEARAGDTNPSFDGGHLREPMLYITNVIRGLGFTNTDPNGYYSSLSNYSTAAQREALHLGQRLQLLPAELRDPRHHHQRA